MIIYLPASEPFPVSRSSLLTEIAKPRTANMMNNNQSSIPNITTANSAEKENLPDEDMASKFFYIFYLLFEICFFLYSYIIFIHLKLLKKPNFI